MNCKDTRRVIGVFTYGDLLFVKECEQEALDAQAIDIGIDGDTHAWNFRREMSKASRAGSQHMDDGADLFVSHDAFQRRRTACAYYEQ
jgi:hypothetical protein